MELPQRKWQQYYPWIGLEPFQKQTKNSHQTRPGGNVCTRGRWYKTENRVSIQGRHYNYSAEKIQVYWSSRKNGGPDHYKWWSVTTTWWLIKRPQEAQMPGFKWEGICRQDDKVVCSPLFLKTSWWEIIDLGKIGSAMGTKCPWTILSFMNLTYNSLNCGSRTNLAPDSRDWIENYCMSPREPMEDCARMYM